jgi:hypothetical protein
MYFSHSCAPSTADSTLSALLFTAAKLAPASEFVPPAVPAVTLGVTGFALALFGVTTGLFGSVARPAGGVGGAGAVPLLVQVTTSVLSTIRDVPSASFTQYLSPCGITFALSRTVPSLSFSVSA